MVTFFPLSNQASWKKIRLAQIDNYVNPQAGKCNIFFTCSMVISLVNGLYHQTLESPKLSLYHQTLESSALNLYHQALESPMLKLYHQILESPVLNLYHQTLESSVLNFYNQTLESPAKYKDWYVLSVCFLVIPHPLSNGLQKNWGAMK